MEHDTRIDVHRAVEEMLEFLPVDKARQVWEDRPQECALIARLLEAADEGRSLDEQAERDLADEIDDPDRREAVKRVATILRAIKLYADAEKPGAI
jgi:hypothetical protein